VVPVSHLLAYAALVSVLIAIPGPSVLFTVSRALTVGRRAALLTVVGNELGLCVQVVAVAFGMGAVLRAWAWAVLVIKLAGALYLVVLGVQAIRHRRSMAEALAARVTPVPPWRAVRDGFVVGAANPKSLVFFVAVLPSFTVAGSGALPVQAQLLLLGGLFPAIALVLDSGWAVVAGTVRQWLVASPRRLAMIGGTGGLVMIGLGVSIAVTGRKNLFPDCNRNSRRLPAAGIFQKTFWSLTHPIGRLPRNNRVTGDPGANWGGAWRNRHAFRPVTMPRAFRVPDRIVGRCPVARRPRSLCRRHPRYPYHHR
jgi:threonine/homoserine/homoserine lactone efflux protein